MDQILADKKYNTIKLSDLWPSEHSCHSITNGIDDMHYQASNNMLHSKYFAVIIDKYFSSKNFYLIWKDSNIMNKRKFREESSFDKTLSNEKEINKKTGVYI